MAVSQKFIWFSKTFKTSRLLNWDDIPKVLDVFENLTIYLQNFLTLLLKKLDFIHRIFRRSLYDFGQNSDRFYTFFKIIDAFPKVLDFLTINFRMYSKNFGGIQKFCIRFSQKLHDIQQKTRLSGQTLRQIFESIWPFSQISDGYYEKNGSYSSYLWTVIACFFDNILIIFTGYSNF